MTVDECMRWTCSAQMQRANWFLRRASTSWRVCVCHIFQMILILRMDLQLCAKFHNGAWFLAHSRLLGALVGELKHGMPLSFVVGEA